MSEKLEFAVGDVKSVKQGSGGRANKGKVAFSLVPLHLLAGAARVFMAGKLKYASWNWAKGMSWSICADCLIRHFIKWWFFGKDYDEETGEHHIDYMICNLLMLKHYSETYKTGDDRPNVNITHFPDAWKNFNKLFDEEDFLKRNPAIQEKINAERKE